MIKNFEEKIKNSASDTSQNGYWEYSLSLDHEMLKNIDPVPFIISHLNENYKLEKKLKNKVEIN